MQPKRQKSILQMARGAIMERADYEMSRLLGNILDPNTSATAKRKLTLTLELKPDDDRQTITVSCTAKPTLAATTVTTQKGVALQGNEQIRPIITLKPYRTFQEVEQPESIFLIRVNERGISFTEADGGMWKLQARETVKAFLENALEAEIAAGEVYIAL